MAALGAHCQARFTSFDSPETPRRISVSESIWLPPSILDRRANSVYTISMEVPLNKGKLELVADTIRDVITREYPGFEHFVHDCETAKWVLISDYSFDHYPNDALVFALRPAEQYLQQWMNEVPVRLPCDLKHSRVEDDVIQFLQSSMQFTFVFLNDRRQRLVSNREQAAEILTLLIQFLEERMQSKIDMIRERNAMTIRNAKKLLGKARCDNFPLTNFSDVVFSAVLASSLGLCLTSKRLVSAIWWMSDRDVITEKWPGLVDALFDMLVHQFVHKNTIFESPSTAWCVQEASEQQRGDQPWFKPFTRCADYFATTLAEVDFSKGPKIEAIASKHHRLRSLVVADNPKVCVLLIRFNEAAWCRKFVLTHTEPSET